MTNNHRAVLRLQNLHSHHSDSYNQIIKQTTFHSQPSLFLSDNFQWYFVCKADLLQIFKPFISHFQTISSLHTSHFYTLTFPSTSPFHSSSIKASLRSRADIVSLAHQGRGYRLNIALTSSGRRSRSCPYPTPMTTTGVLSQHRYPSPGDQHEPGIWGFR